MVGLFVRCQSSEQYIWKKAYHQVGLEPPIITAVDILRQVRDFRQFVLIFIRTKLK